MRLIRTLACAAAAALAHVPGHAAINASGLGAAYDVGQTSINFKVYSSRATRIELWLYAAGSGQAEKLTFDLFFDTTESGMGARVVAVTTLTDKIYQLIKIEPTRHAPPTLTFIWSPDFPGANVGGAAAQQAAASAAVGAALESAATDAAETAAPVPGVGDTALDALGAALGGQRRNAFTCVMESIKQKFTLFSPAGVPLRATLTVSLREYKTLDDQIDEIRPSSPDRTHVHTLRQGESLAAVARRHYDSPREWRAVAEANGIDDPRRLDAGAFLRVPRIR